MEQAENMTELGDRQHRTLFGIDRGANRYSRGRGAIIDSARHPAPATKRTRGLRVRPVLPKPVRAGRRSPSPTISQAAEAS